MMVPVILVPEGNIEFVNVNSIRRMSPMDPMSPDDAPPEDGQPQHLQPDGEPWGTTWLHFTEQDGVRVKGTPQQLCGQWFGPPINERPPSRQVRRANERAGGGIIVPSGIPAVDLKRGGS